MLTSVTLSRLVDAVDCCPWSTTAGRHNTERTTPQRVRVPLYTFEERQRRDTSPWTIVQGVLAPIQFIVFLVSLGLVLHYLLTGAGESEAIFSIIVKTLVLYTIMITGSIWEREIFGRYLFAPAFYWEDVVSMLVLALHTAYIAALVTGTLGAHQLMLLALAAYASYVINAAQFVLKLRAARLAPQTWAAQEAAMGLPQ
jgi:3-vinyl bacteriochlorophyllide hydratase